MKYIKVTPGYVRQVFNCKGKFIGQTFIAGDDVEYETETGDPLDATDMPRGGDEYATFDMVQHGCGASLKEPRKQTLSADEVITRESELERQLADKLSTVTRYAESNMEGGGVCEDKDGEFVSMYDVAKVLGLRLR